MRTPSSNRPTIVAAEMTSMIDVVFLLVIFFLVSSHLAQHHGPKVDLPVASIGETPESSTNWMVVTIDDQGDVSIDGTHFETEVVIGRLREHVRGSGDRAGLRFRVDRRVPFDRVRGLLREAALSGCRRITLATASF